MRCADFMTTEFHCMHEDQSVQLAAQLMRDFNVSIVPVCDARERIVGTLTDRDIAARLCAEDWQASSCPIRDVMSSGVVACGPDDDVAVVDAMMAKFGKRFAVVVSEADQVRGIISRSEFAQVRQATPRGGGPREPIARTSVPQARSE